MTILHILCVCSHHAKRKIPHYISASASVLMRLMDRLADAAHFLVSFNKTLEKVLSAYAKRVIKMLTGSLHPAWSLGCVGMLLLRCSVCLVPVGEAFS